MFMKVGRFRWEVGASGSGHSTTVRIPEGASRASRVRAAATSIRVASREVRARSRCLARRTGHSGGPRRSPRARLPGVRRPRNPKSAPPQRQSRNSAAFTGNRSRGRQHRENYRVSLVAWPTGSLLADSCRPRRVGGHAIRAMYGFVRRPRPIRARASCRVPFQGRVLLRCDTRVPSRGLPQS